MNYELINYRKDKDDNKDKSKIKLSQRGYTCTHLVVHKYIKQYMIHKYYDNTVSVYCIVN